MILKEHGIQDIYHVNFPSEKEALEILCLSAFKKSYVQDGFEEVATRVAALCGNLPLGLCVVGSSLRGESKQEWELQFSRIESSLDRKIEDILRMGYDRLSKKDQSLFLHIACFFNYSRVHDVTSMLADSNLDVENGLKSLVTKSLVNINGPMMHSLLKRLGREVIRKQSDEPGKKQFLEDAKEILDVLANETGTGSVIGISFNMCKINKFSISGRAFERMRNLRFLRIYHSEDVSSLEVSKDMEYLPRLRLLDWNSYPRKCLPPKFQPECLVELCMVNSNLKKLWGGIQPLANLKKVDISFSLKLKEIPNFSKVTNLKELRLEYCINLVELPSSIRNLQKLESLEMSGCVKLRVIPTNINLASLLEVDMSDCSQLRSFPDISRNVSWVDVSNTKIEDIPASTVVRNHICIGSRSLKRLTHVPKCVTWLDLSNSGIKRIPDCVIGLLHLLCLKLINCRKLVSLQNLPPSIIFLDASNCGLLKSVCFLFDKPKGYMTRNDCKCVEWEGDSRSVSYFDLYGRPVCLENCLSLDEEARRVIIQRWDYSGVWLPGKEVPAEFTHRAKGNSITISEGTFSASSKFKVCLLLSSTEQVSFSYRISCRLRSKGVLISELLSPGFSAASGRRQLLMDHLLVFSESLFKNHRCLEKVATASEIQFEFGGINGKIIECGVQIMGEEGESSSCRLKEQSDGSVEISKDESVFRSGKHTGDTRFGKTYKRKR